MTNHKRRRWVFVALLVLTALVLAGCAQRGEEQPEERIALLPRITITVDAEGYPKVFGLSLGTVGRLLGQDFSAARVPPTTLERLQAADIQHIEVVMTKGGLAIFVNGKPMPYLAGDREKLGNLGALLEALGVSNARFIRWGLENIVGRVGLPIAVKFPVAPGNAEIPMADLKDLDLVNVEEVRGRTTMVPLRFYADIETDRQGVLRLAGFTLIELQDAMTKAGLGADLSGLRLNPATVATLAGGGVQHLQMETEPEGIYLCFNGKPLPRLAWDQERMTNLIDLYASLNPSARTTEALRFFLPYLQPSDIELTLYLPRGAEATLIEPCPFVDGQ
ncbi:MAG: hypothetical protein NZ528_05045 [Caldilineales bacterium]|nr:hypothetical protein [Caldilineales bacterium]MDW8316250.1 hypothetical protein [Anaerolineae bacterium]